MKPKIGWIQGHRKDKLIGGSFHNNSKIFFEGKTNVSQKFALVKITCYMVVPVPQSLSGPWVH